MTVAGRTRVAVFRALDALIERVPESVAVSGGRRIARALRVPGARSNLAINLAHALGEGPEVDGPLVERFVDRALASYGQYWAESAKLPALSATTISERFQIAEGRGHLDAAHAAGKGVVIALPHVGSWEWGGAFLAQIGMPMTAVAEALEPPALFQWFKTKRESIGITIEPLDAHAGTVLLDTLRRGGVVGLLCDRDLVGNGIPVEFFGERVTLPAGPATLALRTGATLVAAACYAGPGRDHHAVVTEPIPAERLGRLRDDVARVTQAIAVELEGLIRRAPEQWHVLQPRFDQP